MARKRDSGGGDGDPNWMDTYGDMITLILTFFVLLYAMSSMDSSKWQYIAEAFSKKSSVKTEVQVVGEANENNDPNAIYDNSIPEIKEDNGEIIDFDDFYKYLQEVVASNDLNESVSVEMAEMGVYMRFRDNVFFDGDSYNLREEGKYILDVISDGIREVNEQIYAIKVSGYTASSSTSKMNEWDLSSGRANSVINYMLGLDACEQEKFSSAGYGKNRPIESNDTEEGRRQNRRVEIVFIRNDVDFTDPNVVKELLQLEFGTDFVQYSNADGEPIGEDKEPEETVGSVDMGSETDSGSDENKFVSKNDILKAKER